MAYKVIKWRKGHPYLYEQETYRENGNVKTRNVYLGKYEEMTKKSDKYTTQDALFDEVHGILKNKLGITDNEQLTLIEAEKLGLAYEKASAVFDATHKFSEKDVKYLHRLFLKDIFKWAGTYRVVDISSPNIRYCHASYIQDNMTTFSKRLSELTPFTKELTKDEIIKRLVEIHGELIVIHPFRDGNGRTTRLMCDLLLMQSGRKPLDTTIFYDEIFIKKYHCAIQTLWHSGDYSELENLFIPLVQ